jgi:hypothetical protein
MGCRNLCTPCGMADAKLKKIWHIGLTLRFGGPYCGLLALGFGEC